MELSKETKQSLISVWDDKQTRQDAKTVILEAIGLGSEVSVKVANEILDELDILLIEEKEDTAQRVNKAL
jgi:hypothetical protein